MHFCMVYFFLNNSIFAQDEGRITGNFQLMGQYYMDDAKNDAQVPNELVGFNSFANVIYTKGNFSTGIRLESYEPKLLGYPASPLTTYDGTGIGYRYAKYTDDNVTITIGNFYEQFGAGLILRAYEERNLGVDNALDGVSVNYRIHKGITLKGVYGKQRLGFADGTTKGPGIVRGGDVDFSLNDILDSIIESKTRINIGASLVSKYQQDIDPALILPENLATYGGRININRGGLNIYSEYAHKMNDPSADNGFVYKTGQAFLFNSTYSQKGLGITLGMQYIDNMSFRSDRNAGLTDLLINFVPAVPRQHTYNLPATLYPYGTQLNGEVGLTGEIMYTFAKGSSLGGKYGTTISLNTSFVQETDTTNLNDVGEFGRRQGYTTNVFSLKGRTFFRDIHIEVNKKFNKKWKANFMFLNFVYNIEVVQGKIGDPNIGALMGIADINYKISKKHALRTEMQLLFTGNYFMKDANGVFQTFKFDKQIDQGHWATGLIEYTYSPHWFVAIQNQYNFGNNKYNKLHYPLVSFGYIKHATRFMVTAGRQRAGLFCVGGVCREVPASTGVSLTITSSF